MTDDYTLVRTRTQLLDLAIKHGWSPFPVIGHLHVFVRDSEFFLVEFTGPHEDSQIGTGWAISALAGEPVRIPDAFSADDAWDRAASWLTEDRTPIIAAPEPGPVSRWVLDWGQLRTFAGFLVRAFDEDATVNAREMGRVLQQMVEPPAYVTPPWPFDGGRP